MKLLTSLLHGALTPLKERLTGVSQDLDAEEDLPIPLLRRAPVQPKITDPDILDIRCPDPTAEDAVREEHIKRGQFLARQERWDDLSHEIRSADDARAMTPGSMMVSDLMAYGARADVVLAAEHALLHGRPAKDAPLMDGIEALEHVLADNMDDPIITCIIAQAYLDIAWCWRGSGWDIEVLPANRAAFDAHFDRATSIMAIIPKTHWDIPYVAATRCALLSGTKAHARDVADLYEKLIDLNPANPRPLRALGGYLLPRWGGNYEALELEARRTAARTIDVWGAGGYTWTQFDAVAQDDEACARLDVPFFIEGLHDILERSTDSYTANLLAAYCANAVAQTYSGNDTADHNRAQIAECASWIVRNHLTELHPMIWAHAARGFDNNLAVRFPARFAIAGREDAQRIIMTLFSREISNGHRIVFTDTGPVAHPARATA